MTTPQIGYGVTFSIYNGSTYDAFGNIMAATPPSVAHGNVETTHMTSTNRYRTRIPGLRDAEQASFTLQFDPSEVSTLKTEADRDTNNSYKIAFSDGESVTFSGIFSFSLGQMTPDGLMTADVTIDVSGEPTWA